MKDKEVYTRFSEYISHNKKELFQKILPERTRHITLVLEDIYQSQNASAVLRTCEAMGIQDVHIIENKYRFKINDDIARGAAQWLSLNYYNQSEENSAPCIDSLKKNNYQIVATSPHSNKTIENIDVNKKTALVLGHEKKGVSEYIARQADEHIKIPIYGFTESYNLSVAAALTLQECIKNTRALNIDWPLSKKEQEALEIEWAQKSVSHGAKIYNHLAQQMKNEQH